MTIIDAELDVCPSYGWQGGPEFNTLIKQFRSGRERRKPLWSTVRHRYILPVMNIKDDEYLAGLKSAYLSAMGSAYAFRVKDWSDFIASNQVFAAGDGVTDTFDISITSSFGDASYTRRIVWPIDPVFTVDGTPVSATFDYDNGVVVFDSPPTDLSVLRWSGQFRIIVRFASDTFPMTIDNRIGGAGGSYAMNGSIELMEVLE
jgi:uncharacterized protein (TIGR02217 family)